MKHSGSWKDNSRTNLPTMSYCDYIAHTIIRPGLQIDGESLNGLISSVSHVNMDLHKEGWMQTTKKTVKCKDINGKEYLITIEEV